MTDHAKSIGRTDPIDVSRLAVGDRIFVEGEADDGFWDDREISAHSIFKIGDMNGRKERARTSTDREEG